MIQRQNTTIIVTVVTIFDYTLSKIQKT